MTHDKVSRKHIPSIYSRSAYVSHITRWPQGGVCIKPIHGKHVINNTGKVTYVTGTDGIIYSVPPLNGDSREVLLRQLYYMLGMEVQHAESAYYRENPRLLLDPIPNAHKYVKASREYYYEPATWSLGGADVPKFTERFLVEPDENVKYQDFERFIPEAVDKYIDRANQADKVNHLTLAIRRNEPCVFILDFLFSENLRYEKDEVRHVVKLHDHLARTQRNPELLNLNFNVTMLDGSFTSAEDVMASRRPSMVYTKVDVKNIERAHQGHYLPEYGFTISNDPSDLMNKALGFALPDSDVYIAKTGLRIVIPQRPAGAASLYCRIGKHVSRINCNDSPDITGDHAIAYCFDANGDEVIAGSCHVDELISKGMSMKTPDGVSWHIPFFLSKSHALDYRDPEDRAVFENQRDIIIQQKKRLEKLEEELDKKKEIKRKGVIAWVTSFLTNPKTMAFVTAIVISAITALVGNLRSSAAIAM